MENSKRSFRQTNNVNVRSQEVQQDVFVGISTGIDYDNRRS